MPRGNESQPNRFQFNSSPYQELDKASKELDKVSKHHQRSKRFPREETRFNNENYDDDFYFESRDNWENDFEENIPDIKKDINAERKAKSLSSKRMHFEDEEKFTSEGSTKLNNDYGDENIQYEFEDNAEICIEEAVRNQSNTDNQSTKIYHNPSRKIKSNH